MELKIIFQENKWRIVDADGIYEEPEEFESKREAIYYAMSLYKYNMEDDLQKVKNLIQQLREE